jgi:hypothetical protein
MFIHGGLLHFAFNNWALYVLGYQIEHLLRPSRYLLLYVLSGIVGNIASTFWSVSVGVGASGALFGLLGCGFYIERAIQSRLQSITGIKTRRGAYTWMVVANLMIGLIIPQIDNAAHLGGLVAGIIFGYVLLRLRPNRLMKRQPFQAYVVTIIFTGICLGVAALASSNSWVKSRLLSSAQSAQMAEERFFYLARAIDLDPEDESLRLRRLFLSLQLERYDTASADFLELKSSGRYNIQLREIAIELQRAGLFGPAKWLESRLDDKVLEL